MVLLDRETPNPGVASSSLTFGKISALDGRVNCVESNLSSLHSEVQRLSGEIERISHEVGNARIEMEALKSTNTI